MIRVMFGLKKKNLEEVIQLDKQNNLTVYIADICDQEKMDEIFGMHAPDVICHLAARAGVRGSIGDPVDYMQSNIIGTTVLLEMAQKYKVPHVVYASSSSVYGSRENGPFFESDHVEKQSSPYGMSKCACELLAQVYYHLYGITCTGLRFFTVYGPRGRVDMAPFIFMDAIAREKRINIFGDGSVIRDFTYVDDIVDGVIKSIDRPIGCQTLNLGRGEPTILSNFIKTLEVIIGKKAILNYTNAIIGDVPLTHADISKAKELIGYAPKISVKEGLENMWKWYETFLYFNRDVRCYDLEV